MNKEEKLIMQQDYEDAFNTKEAPGYKLKALGILILVGGIIWSAISYIGGKGSLQPLPYITAILGAILCGVGELNEIKYTLIQNQLKSEYFMKYGNAKPDDEE